MHLDRERHEDRGDDMVRSYYLTLEEDDGLDARWAFVDWSTTGSRLMFASARCVRWNLSAVRGGLWADVGLGAYPWDQMALRHFLVDRPGHTDLVGGSD